ncbi:transcription termination factor Rho [Gordonibacter sp. 28C]|uniref:transcription termination factor Rho n=1 Tax=Gordonibacter sp. 28C TaxID=2078569 RepID=UPI000DF7836C|nr:transcription termination factor Rho [Gordonibacter sp. 28C]RDB63192.1 transcription termination factor Rho [Gordonibacter sp. 28C]
MSDNETASMTAEAPAPASKPTRRRSTSVNAKAAAAKEPAAKISETQAEGGAPATRAARTPRKSVKAGGTAAPQQGPGTAKRPGQNSSGRNNAGSSQSGGNRQKQNGNQRQNASGGKQGNNSNNNNNNRRQRRPHDNNRGPREVQPSVSRDDLTKLKVAELREKAAELGVDAAGLKKAELVEAVFEASVKAEGFIEVSGILDILADGYGFLRTQGYLPSESDCYVGLSTIRRNGLRKGDLVTGQTRPARENEKYAAIQKVTAVNGTPIEECGNRVRFGDLTPVYPDECFHMEHGKSTVTARVIDLVSPIGKGQRGLIVSPPKAGKTTVLKDIAAAISANNPEVHLMCLLVDERPEEVTDMERSIKGEVVSSTFDMPTENHIAVAELVIERAKRLVECGKDVVVLLDSLTRLARAYNLAQPASGRILSGGVDSTALYPPKRFLGAARNIEHGGSLTILASALIDTGSKMDEVIFEEFKGTGNMELKLDRNLADRRIFPAIDPVASGTRKEELLLDPQEAPLIWAVRRILSNTNNTERAMDMLIKSLKQTDTNQEFLLRTAKKAQHSKGDAIEI